MPIKVMLSSGDVIDIKTVVDVSSAKPNELNFVKIKETIVFSNADFQVELVNVGTSYEYRRSNGTGSINPISNNWVPSGNVDLFKIIKGSSAQGAYYSIILSQDSNEKWDGLSQINLTLIANDGAIYNIQAYFGVLDFDYYQATENKGSYADIKALYDLLESGYSGDFMVFIKELKSTKDA